MAGILSLGSKFFKNKLFLTRTLAWIGVFIYMLVIFCFSSHEADKSDSISKAVVRNIIRWTPKFGGIQEYLASNMGILNHLLRKCAHFVEFFILSMLIAHAFKKTGAGSLKGLLFSVFICALYSCVDELHQRFVPGRGPGIKDVAIDIFGAIFAVAIIFLKRAIKKVRYHEIKYNSKQWSLQSLQNGIKTK